ncbi:hypothetical protein CMPELA_29685 [Cupriavidus necator]
MGPIFFSGQSRALGAQYKTSSSSNNSLSFCAAERARRRISCSRQSVKHCAAGLRTALWRVMMPSRLVSSW